MKSYEYHIPKWIGFTCLLLFGLFTYMSLMTALNGGTLSYKTVRFSETFTHYFAWASVVIFGSFALLGAFAIVKAFGKPRIVRVYDDKICAPKAPYSNQIHTIFYRDMTECTLYQVGITKQLIIRDKNQKIALSEMNFINRNDFAELVQDIQKYGQITLG